MNLSMIVGALVWLAIGIPLVGFLLWLITAPFRAGAAAAKRHRTQARHTGQTYRYNPTTGDWGWQ